MWQFYTERGKRVVKLAHQEALNLGHSMVEPEHLLIGVLQEGGGIACQALIELGVDPDNLAAHVRDLIGRSQDVIAQPEDLPLSPRMKRALDVAMAEARKMGVNYVDTEHILLGILSDDSGLAVQQFKAMGLTQGDLRLTIYRHTHEIQLPRPITWYQGMNEGKQKKKARKIGLLNVLSIRNR